MTTFRRKSPEFRTHLVASVIRAKEKYDLPLINACQRIGLPVYSFHASLKIAYEHLIETPECCCNSLDRETIIQYVNSKRK